MLRFLIHLISRTLGGGGSAPGTHGPELGPFIDPDGLGPFIDPNG